ncbi:uncharacterized protein EURHEDRAFT_411099 [Aspergillus ruber CBS 135680]|uniref:Uncharacterized protein n=1 Tax=Aspergillus ruber (strain CBS 135680) TaxID=1388766 RepID=A0A017SI43_ASPRC|nr:uncharacterized protein EURHEDRAFT_411099 [Aspergillus ruber CBS 135680]EYE96593.1 hypothetical protein EURHEDRAFT_411099 [Aspergillus ruber CBS 135680]
MRARYLPHCKTKQGGLSLIGLIASCSTEGRLILASAFTFLLRRHLVALSCSLATGLESPLTQ